MLSSGGEVRATSFEMSPVVLGVLLAAAVVFVEKSDDILSKMEKMYE